MRKFLYIILVAMSLASCARYRLPSFGTSNDWKLQGGTVSNKDLSADFGGNGILANAGNGGYDLNFITSQMQFNACDTKIARYITEAVKQIPLKIDSIDVVLADQFLILRTNPINAWKPDYVRRQDGAVLTVQANPVSSLVQPHDELWRNLVINKNKHQIIVVDRFVKNGTHYAIVYILQSESKSSPFTRVVQFDITNPSNLQSTGTLIDGLMQISANALEGNVKTLSYDEYVMQADACFMQGDFIGASNAFDNAFTMEESIQNHHLYNSACAAALAGLNDKAFERLNMLLQRDPDWYVEDPNRDNDLVNLHSDARWHPYCDTIIARRERIEANFDKPLVTRLREIARSDQAIRYEFLNAYNAQPRNQALVDSLTNEMQRIDSINQSEICDILDSRGFVGKDVVGDACAVYWLVIQHSPVELQKKYFPMFVEAMHRGEMAKSQVAMMDDRIAMFEGRPQKYGSQIVENEKGQRVIYNLLDPAKVDQWRSEMDLNPLSDYMKQMGVEQ